MTDIIRVEIENAVRAITKSMQPQRIYLFGSQSSGTATDGSDIDLCVIASLGETRKIDALRKMRRAMLPDVNASIDLLVYDASEFAIRSAMPTTMEYIIAAEGSLIYEQ